MRNIQLDHQTLRDYSVLVRYDEVKTCHTLTAIRLFQISLLQKLWYSTLLAVRALSERVMYSYHIDR
jgi:hypothetical protein